MAASASDYFMKVAMSTATTMSAPGYTIGNTTINVGSTTNWVTDTGVIFGVDEIDADGERVAGTYNIFRGTVASATQLSNVVYVGGDANRNYSAGSTTRVYILVSYAQMNRLIDGLLVSLDQDGTLKAGAVDVSAVLADLVVTNAKIADATVSHEKLDATIAARAYLNSAQSINNGAARKVLLDTENFDLGSDFDTANSRFVAPVTGYYRITGQVGVANVDAAGNVCEAYIYVNGANYATGRSIAGGTSGSGNDPIATVSTLAPVTAGQYIELYALHDSATTSEALQTGTTVTFLSVEFVGV